MTATLIQAPGQSRQRTTLVDVVVPVYNEEADLERSVRRLHEFLADDFPYPFTITIADNASTDRTWPIAQGLATELDRVRAVHLDEKGRGRALKQVWLASEGTVLAYMDVDLSTDLRALLPLVAPLISGHSDLAIGTRLSRASRVVRGPKREFISRSYNVILRTSLGARFSDAQCGFKALRADVARELLPLVENNEWFFDTEMLILAQRAGLRIHEVPVDWVDDPGTTVNVVATAKEDLRGVGRLMRAFARGTLPLDRVKAEARRPEALPSAVPGVPRGLTGQVARFAAIGVLSTIAYFVIYLLLRLAMGPQAANLAAMLITAVANTAFNRRVTFGKRGRANLLRDHAGGLIAFFVALGFTAASLWALHTYVAQPSRVAEVAVLVLANAVGTVVRFVTLRQLFRHRA